MCLCPWKNLPPGSIFHISLPQQTGALGHGLDMFSSSSIPQFMDDPYYWWLLAKTEHSGEGDCASFQCTVVTSYGEMGDMCKI